MKKYIESSDAKYQYGKIRRDGTVYRFTVWYDGDAYDTQYRYVLADSEAEAVAKLEEYNDYMDRNGFEPFIYSDPVVELWNVIY